MKIIFDGNKNKNTMGTDPEFMMIFLKNKEHFWNEWRMVSHKPVTLYAVLDDLQIDMQDSNLAPYLDEIRKSCWTANGQLPIAFGLYEPINQNAWDGASNLAVLEFNCDGEIANADEIAPYDTNRVIEGKTSSCVIKPRCYYWKQWKFHVPVEQITLRGWIQWCNELFQLQHGKPRPKSNQIFLNADMTEATVKARVWNRARIEQWLKDHGYDYTVTCETKYQFKFENPEDVELVDADVMPDKRKRA